MFFRSIDNFDVVNETNPNPNLGRGNLTNFKAWTLRDDRTRFNLILHCGDVQVQMIRQLKTSKEVRKKLKVIYMHTNQTTQLVS